MVHPVSIIHTDSNGKTAWDPFSYMLEQRIIYLTNEIEPVSADWLIAQILFLQHRDSTKKITIYINSPGGHVRECLSIYDTMQHVSCPIETIVLGQASSAAFVIAVAGTKGMRFAMPNAEMMIHQVNSGVRNTTTEVIKHAKRIEKLNQRLVTIIREHTGMSEEDAAFLMENTDHYFDAEESIQKGFIDRIIVPEKKIVDGVK